MSLKDKKGIILITCYLIIVVLLILGSAFLTQSIVEKRVAERERDYIRAFYIAEGGLDQAISNLKKDFENDSSWADGGINGISVGPNTDTFYALYSGVPLGNGNYGVELKNVVGKDNEIWIRSTGTLGGLSRTIQSRIKIENPWLNKIPGAVYSNSAVKVKFDKRDNAYIDGWDDEDAGIGVAGIYSTGETKVKREGEGRITGTPQGILEGKDVPESLQDGIWDAFDCDALREIARANDTYFQGDEYNKGGKKAKKAKYTLPVVEGETVGVFFFDTKDGVPFDDDILDKRNEAKVELKGTTEQMSGIIVVVGDLKIVDTKDYDFLFDGVILVLDDLKLDDKRRHRRYKKDSSVDSDIFIKGAVLSDDIIQKGKRKEGEKSRKKKPSMDIKNATIEYDVGAIGKTLGCDVKIESWQEI